MSGSTTTVNPFIVRIFCYIEALLSSGREQEGRLLIQDMLAEHNRLGLLSEDTAVGTGELGGNFSQSYSLVGPTARAARVSRRREAVL